MLPLPYLKLVTYALAVAVGFGMGWKVNGWRYDAAALAEMEAEQAAIEASAEQARKLLEAQVQLRDERLQAAAVLEVERSKQAEIVTREVTRDVIKYVNSPGAAVRCLDADGVRILNAAAAGVPQVETSGTPDAGAATATAARVVESVAENYSVCHANSNQLRALQDWVRAQ